MVKALFEEFERLRIAPKLQPNTAASYRSAFQVHIDPIIGRKRAADVQPADLLRYQSKLDGHRASANRACGRQCDVCLGWRTRFYR